MGHEHPAIQCGRPYHDQRQMPLLPAPARISWFCPAFSRWSAGSNIRGPGFLSAFAQEAVFTHAHAILSGRLLSIPLKRTPG